MNRKEIKEKAKNFAFNNKWNLWKPYLVIGLIGLVFGTVVALFGVNDESVLYSFLNLAFELAILPLSVGVVYYTIELVRGNKLDVKDALLAKYNIYGLILVTGILVGIFTFLWSILLVVPGLIFAFKMSMVNALLADKGEKGMTAKAIMNTSTKMMDGYKMDYLVFNLSFIGWYLLGAITLGIAFIWVIPYITTADIMYYEELLKVKKITKVEE